MKILYRNAEVVVMKAADFEEMEQELAEARSDLLLPPSDPLDLLNDGPVIPFKVLEQEQPEVLGGLDARPWEGKEL